MCGQFIHIKFFIEVMIDFRAIKLLGTIVNKKIEKEGIKVISSITYMEKYLPKNKGILTNFSKKIDK